MFSGPKVFYEYLIKEKSSKRVKQKGLRSGNRRNQVARRRDRRNNVWVHAGNAMYRGAASRATTQSGRIMGVGIGLASSLPLAKRSERRGEAK